MYGGERARGRSRAASRCGWRGRPSVRHLRHRASMCESGQPSKRILTIAPWKQPVRTSLDEPLGLVECSLCYSQESSLEPEGPADQPPLKQAVTPKTCEGVEGTVRLLKPDPTTVQRVVPSVRRVRLLPGTRFTCRGCARLRRNLTTVCSSLRTLVDLAARARSLSTVFNRVSQSLPAVAAKLRARRS